MSENKIKYLEVLGIYSILILFTNCQKANEIELPVEMNYVGKGKNDSVEITYKKLDDKYYEKKINYENSIPDTILYHIRDSILYFENIQFPISERINKNYKIKLKDYSDSLDVEISDNLLIYKTDNIIFNNCQSYKIYYSRLNNPDQYDVVYYIDKTTYIVVKIEVIIPGVSKPKIIQYIISYS